MKRFLTFLLIASLAITLWGCSQTPGSADTTGASAVTEQTKIDSAGTEPSETVPIDTEEESQQEDGSGIRSLRCVPGGGMIMSVVPCSGGEALILCTADETGGRYILCRVDLKADQVLAQCDAGQDWPLGRRRSGETVTVNYETKTLRLWDENLKRAEEFPFPGNLGYYNQAEDRVYAVDGGTLTRMDFSGKTEELLSFRSGAKIKDVDPVWGRVLVEGLPSDDRADSANLLFTLDGTKLYGEESDRFPVGFTQDGALLRGYGEAGGLGELAICDPSGAHTVWALEDSREVFSFPGAGLLGVSEHGANGGTTLSALDTRSGRLMQIASYPDQRYVTFAWWAEVGNLVVGVSGSGHAKLLLVDPTLLQTQTQLAAAVPKEAAPAEPLPALSGKLEELRRTADRLEKTYGVRILFGVQATSAPMGQGHQFTYTDALPRGQEYNMLVEAMPKVEAVLSCYPEGFFQNFRNYENAAGVRILLVHELGIEGGSLHAESVTYRTGGWYNIALQTEGLTESGLHHELWHAVEYRLEDVGYPMDEDYWHSLNSEGFVYADGPDAYQAIAAQDGAYIMGAPDPEQVCCIGSYSVVSEREDRANLIEFLFSGENTPQRQIASLRDYPLLLAKLRYLEERTALLFGSAYWNR